jgi:hypothetical protein
VAEELIAAQAAAEDSDGFDDDEDDAFMREFRAKRLQGGRGCFTQRVLYWC